MELWTLNARERFLAVMDFEPCNRTLIWEWGYWEDSIERWHREGLVRPTGKEHTKKFSGEGGFIGYTGGYLEDVFGFDKEPFRLEKKINRGMIPPFEEKILKENGENVIFQNERGIVVKYNKKSQGIPLFLEHPVRDKKSFEEIKERLQPDLDRRYPENWDEEVKTLSQRDYPLFAGGFPWGIFGACREFMGLVPFLENFFDNPSLIKEMMNFVVDFLSQVWEDALTGVKPEAFIIWEDMAYKNGSLISPSLFKEFMMPAYKRLVGFIRDTGVRNILVDTDGNCSELIPLFIECGVTGLFPFEVQAGMNIVKVGKEYPKLQIIGGLDKTKIAKGKKLIDLELESKVPFMLKRGGYIPWADHYIPSDVSWDNFEYYRRRLEEMIRKCRHKLKKGSEGGEDKILN